MHRSGLRSPIGSTQHHRLSRIPQGPNIPIVYNALQGGKTLAQLDRQFRLVLVLLFRLGCKPLVYNGLTNHYPRTMWHLLCTTIGRSEGSPVGTQMAVACPNEHLSVGARRTRVVYAKLTLFCKTQDVRNTISRLLHAITHGGFLGRRIWREHPRLLRLFS